MPVSGVDHINIRTTDAAASAQFYVDLLDFEYRSGQVMGYDSHWLFNERGEAIIHLRVLEADSQSTGPIDHVALNCSGKAELLERLEARNIKFDLASLQPGMSQIMLQDPHGVSLELRFKDE